MRHQGLKLIVLAFALLMSLFHAEVFAQFNAIVGDTSHVPGYLKVLAGAGVVALLAIRHLR